MSKYYKWTVKWSSGKDTHTFYKPDNCGYTHDINKAGVYGEDEIDDCPWVINTEEDLERAKNNPDYHPVFAVPVDNVEILGRKMTVIRN